MHGFIRKIIILIIVKCISHQKNHEMPELTNWQRMVYEWNKTPYTGKLLFPNGFIQPEYFKILPRDDSVDSKLLIPCR